MDVSGQDPRFNPGKEPLSPLNRRLGGPRRRSERFGQEENHLHRLGFETRTVPRYPGSSVEKSQRHMNFTEEINIYGSSHLNISRN